MKETIFTKIANKQIPAFIVDENDKFMAFLDIQPTVYAQTLVIPKTWHDSYLFNNEDEFIAEFFVYVKKIAKLLDAKLGSERCLVMFEGYGVDHLHAKLYPVHSAEEALAFNLSNRVVFSDEIGEEILKKIKK